MIKGTNSILLSKQSNIDSSSSQCICQICTCHKHKCPHSKVNIPFNEITSYQKEYVPHSFKNTASKPCTESQSYQYKPYGAINSKYREDYPGHKPQMRQKLVPRVKNQDRHIPFEGQSWTKSTYVSKSVAKDNIRNKDKQYNPILSPFLGTSTYKADFYRKQSNPNARKQPQLHNFPSGYKFDGSTTYSKDYIEKGVQVRQNYKPVQRVGQKGKHYLNSTYRDDFTQKQSSQVCPVVTLPKYPQQVISPIQHIAYNKISKIWEAV